MLIQNWLIKLAWVEKVTTIKSWGQYTTRWQDVLFWVWSSVDFDQKRVQILLGWYLRTSATASVAEAITAGYFVCTGIEVFVAENIGVNIEFGLYLEEEWW